MGWLSPAERKESAQWERERQEKITSRRMDIASKITMVIVDNINAQIVRPGPKPEERECYVMAQELRDHSPEIARLVAQVLATENL